MKKSGVKLHQVDEQVSDANMSRRHLIQGGLLSTVAASAPVEAAEQSAHQGGGPNAEVEAIERKLMWLYSNDLTRHVNEIMEYFDDTPEMLQFDVMSPREFKGAAFRKHFNDLVTMFSANIKVDIMDMHQPIRPAAAMSATSPIRKYRARKVIVAIIPVCNRRLVPHHLTVRALRARPRRAMLGSVDWQEYTARSDDIVQVNQPGGMGAIKKIRDQPHATPRHSSGSSP